MLAPGTRLGSFEITGTLGAGGMGEVYRARDTRLKREVALKFLPESFAADPDRLARFQREAEVLASLNHPYIAAIHGVEESNGTRALILELVDGETLADRIARGPIPLDEALPIAKQIAEALEAAHGQGIIHRDLKPANIKVRDDGTVKVLDFGLAKLVEAGGPGVAGGADALSQSPTITTPAMTGVGVILGTAAYMAPEQARGKPVDRRADIWAFGCVLYEMLTGTRAFEAEDVSLTLAAVMKSEPTWDGLPSLPAPLGMFLRQALRKEPRQRLGDIREMRLALEGTFELPGAAVAGGSSFRGGRVPWMVAGVMGILALAALARPLRWNAVEESPNVVRFEITMPAGEDLFRGGGAAPALTPDGQSVIYIGASASGQALYRRPLDQLSAVIIPGSEGSTVFHPTVSPDGTRLAFGRNGRLTILDVAGGIPRVVSDRPVSMGVAWQNNETLIATEGPVARTLAGNLRLLRIPVTGGSGELLFGEQGTEGTGYNYPSVSTDGSLLAYTVWRGTVEDAQVAVRRLDSDKERILVDGSTPIFTASGHLVFVRDDALWAMAFDARQMQPLGDAVRVVEGVQVNSGGLGLFAASPSGTLAYVPGGQGTQRTLVAVDPSGAEEDQGLPAREYDEFRVSPDGRRVALVVRDAVTRRGGIWIWDFARPFLTRLTGAADVDYGNPIWSPDGSQVVYSVQGGAGEMLSQPFDGARVARSLGEGIALEFLDASSLLLREAGPGERSRLSVVNLASGVRRIILESEAQIGAATASPDGDWLAYEIYELGQWHLFVRPYRDIESQRVQISTEGAGEPAWSPAGDELYFRQIDGQLMRVAVASGGDAAFGPPAAVLPPLYSSATAGVARRYDVLPDGRFLMAKEGGGRIVIVQSWTSELQRLVPSR